MKDDPEGAPAPRAIDLTNPIIKTISEYADRIRVLLEKQGATKTLKGVPELDDLLGSLYALICAVEGGFQGKTRQSDFGPVLDRSKELAAGQFKAHGNWMAGFHFNSAMFRISAVFDRLPQVLTGKDKHRDSTPAIKAAIGFDVDTSKAHDIRKEVVKIKHFPDGTYHGRAADANVPEALAAINDLLTLAEKML